MKIRGKAAYDYEFDFHVAQRLDRLFKLNHERLRALPRTFDACIEACAIFFARSEGVNRNCTMSSVKSIP